MKNILYFLLFVPFTFLGQNTAYVEQDIPLELQEGWNMFGYSCYEPMDVIAAFSPVVDKVVIVKDNSGAVYMTEFGFNGIGNLEINRGYQIKTTEAISDFQFCSIIIQLIEGCMDESAFNYNASVNSDDGSCVAVVNGCIASEACNYTEIANTDDGSCEYAAEGFDCDGNSLQVLEIGALMNGGIVFYIDETGQHGLVAATEDLTEGSNMGPWGTPEGFEWGCYGSTVSGADGQSIGTGYQNTLDIVAQNCQTENGGITAAQATLNYESEGYSDWYLPSKDELVEMHNTIGNGGLEGNIGGFEMSDYPYYWSSSENINNYAWYVYFSNGLTSNYYKNYSLRVRAVRAF